MPLQRPAPQPLRGMGTGQCDTGQIGPDAEHWPVGGVFPSPHRAAARPVAGRGRAGHVSGMRKREAEREGWATDAAPVAGREGGSEAGMEGSGIRRSMWQLVCLAPVVATAKFFGQVAFEVSDSLQSMQ